MRMAGYLPMSNLAPAAMAPALPIEESMEGGIKPEEGEQGGSAEEEAATAAKVEAVEVKKEGEGGGAGGEAAVEAGV